MPDTDLDTELTRLREELRSSLPVPGLNQIVARHKQRVVRRRMQVGAVVAVLVVSTAIPLLRNQMSDTPPASPPPPESPFSAPDGPFISDMEFADADHGYAIRANCKNGPRVCTGELLATDDGTHWKSRHLPKPDTTPSWDRGSLSVLGPEEIAIDWSTSPAAEGTGISRAHSVDGGETWTPVEVPDVVTDTISAIPEGGVLVRTCAHLVADDPRVAPPGSPVGDKGQCAERGFAVLQPGSGKSAVLEHRPPLTAMIAGEAPTRDGVWWVTGRDPETDHWGIAVSDDDGRSWTTTVIDLGDPVSSYGWSVDSVDGTLYATAIGALPGMNNGLLGIFRSTDGGHGWQQTWHPGDGKEPGQVYDSTIVGADGRLTISSRDDKLYESKDGGRTFTQVEARYTGYASRTRTGYIASPLAQKGLLLSEDGVHWRKYEIG